jgi:hypothetical protein
MRWIRPSSVLGLHRVVEVAAQQRPLAPGQVAGCDPQGGVVDDGAWDEAALQAGGLVGADLGDTKLLLDVLGVAAADRIMDRPGQQAPLTLP